MQRYILFQGGIMTYHEHFNMEIEKHSELLYPELLSDILSPYTLALIVDDLGIVLNEHPVFGFSCLEQHCSSAILTNDNWKGTSLWVKRRMLARLKELDEQVRWELGLDDSPQEEEEESTNSDLGLGL